VVMNENAIEDCGLQLEGLFNIWKQRNYDLGFYFENIFEKALGSLKARTMTSGIDLQEDGRSRYKGMFIPVGFNFQNIALISALFNPDRLSIAFSETTRAFHRRHFNIIEEKIREQCTGIEISRTPLIPSEDHRYMEKCVIDWAYSMENDHGLHLTKLALDLTGGTKPMSIGAQNASASLGIPAFYLSVQYDREAQPIPGTESLLRMPHGKSQTQPNKVFVIMPFKPEFDKVYENIVKATKAVGLVCTRVDKEIFSGGIMDQVMDLMARAGVVIAELTEQNPNVYYELGLAHAWKKRVVMVTQEVKRLPFDLKHLRTLVYDPNDQTDFRKCLKQELENAKSKL
jgi:hypothetical protein